MLGELQSNKAEDLKIFNCRMIYSALSILLNVEQIALGIPALL